MTLSAAARVLFAALLVGNVLWGTAASAAEPAVSASVTVQPTGSEEPPAPAAAAPSGQPALPATASDKVGRFMVNLKIGPAFLAYPTFSGGVTLVQAALTAEFGFAVTPNRNGYLLFPLGFQLSPGSSLITIPVGFQYDIPLPVRGLYLTPRGIVGYTAAITNSTSCSGGSTGSSCTTSTFVSHLGVVIPEIGVKYIVKGRFNIGFDPFSLPIYFGGGGGGCNANGTVCTKSATAVLFYRLLFYGGINF